jgi:hypothetical protein
LERRPEGGGHRCRWQPTPCCPTCSPPCSHPACSLPPPFIDHPGHMQRCARHIGPGVRKMSEKFRFTMGNFKNRLADTKRTPSLAHPLASPPGPPGPPGRLHAATAGPPAPSPPPPPPSAPAAGLRGTHAYPCSLHALRARGLAAQSPPPAATAIPEGARPGLRRAGGATCRNSSPARPALGAPLVPADPSPFIRAARPPPAARPRLHSPRAGAFGGLRLSQSPPPA